MKCIIYNMRFEDFEEMRSYLRKNNIENDVDLQYNGTHLFGDVQINTKTVEIFKSLLSYFCTL